MTQNYYTGGLAEIVPQPTPITFSYFSNWFAGNHSVGRAMKMLQLPYEPLSVSVLALHGDDLVTNLTTEEKTLYHTTVFSYRYNSISHEKPKLYTNWRKVLDPFCWAGTGRILSAQTRWIAHPEEMISFATRHVARMSMPTDRTEQQLDTELSRDIWPVVIAVGMLAEFYMELVHRLEKKYPDQHIADYVVQEVAKRDWFFKSIAQIADVKEGHLSFHTYLTRYRLRADIDYELSCPRWHEIEKLVQQRIKNFRVPRVAHEVFAPNIPSQDLSHVHAAIELAILRMEAKRKALVYMDELRQSIIKLVGHDDIAHLTREDIKLGNFAKKKPAQKPSSQHKKNHAVIRHGLGVKVSKGVVHGKAQVVLHSRDRIQKNAIGIFPNASPEFSIQFTQCSGIIFLTGGQTSHGAIVAREFGIPAIIDRSAQEITDGAQLELDGFRGSWNVIG